MNRFDFLAGIVRRAGRGLARSPGFTSAVILSLTLGVGANTAVFSLVERALLRPLPFPRAEALVAIGTSRRDGLSWLSSDYNYLAWKQANSLTTISWVRDGSRAFIDRTGERIKGAIAAHDLPEVLQSRPVLGRWFSQDEAASYEPLVVISYSLWQREFGADSTIVGRSGIRIDDRPATIIGVLGPNVAYPLDAEFWSPSSRVSTFEVVARIQPNVPIVSAQRELRTLALSVDIGQRTGNPIEVVVTPLHERLYGNNRPILRLLLGTVALLLVLTCTNVANLSLARTLERQRELAVCVALGASRTLLAFQVVIENLMLAVASAIGGVFLALVATGVFVRLSPAELAGVQGARVGITGVVVAVALAIASAVAVSVAPTVALSRGDLRTTIGQSSALGAGSTSMRRARSALVVAQLVLALLMLTGTGLLIRSMARLAQIDTGFNTSGLAVSHFRLVGAKYRTPEARLAFTQELVARVRSTPGVRSVAVGPPPLIGGHGPIFVDGWSNIFAVRDSAARGAPEWNVWVKYVDDTYLETFRIRLREGRGILQSDGAGAPAVALINESARRLFFGEGSAINRDLKQVPKELSGGRPVTVVGVLADVRQRDITVPPYPEIWVPMAQQVDRDRSLYLSARTDRDARTLARHIRDLASAIDPELQPRRASTMQQVIDEALAPQRFVLIALGGFATLALALAALGLYAVVAFFTTARTREIGIRIALGAKPIEVLWMILRDGLRLALLGAAIGIPLALAASRVMAGFLYEVHVRDAFAFLAAPMVLAIAALVAVYLPARRAALVDPSIALRAES